MNRLIACLMIAGFVAQQFVCCCAEVRPSTTQSGQQVTVTRTVKLQRHCCSKHHDHGRVSQTAADPAGNLPLKGDHHHHVCVGTHIFFRTAERFDVSQFVISPALFLAVTLPVELLQASTTDSTLLTDEDGPLCRALSRPALGVYRI